MCKMLPGTEGVVVDPPFTLPGNEAVRSTAADIQKPEWWLGRRRWKQEGTPRRSGRQGNKRLGHSPIVIGVPGECSPCLRGGNA